VLKDAPSLLHIETFHELRSTRGVQRSTELAEFVGTILREHFSKFWKE
jgi:hypothetical protein